MFNSWRQLFLNKTIKISVSMLKVKVQACMQA